MAKFGPITIASAIKSQTIINQFFQTPKKNKMFLYFGNVLKSENRNY